MWGIVTLCTLLYLQEPQPAHQKETPIAKVTMGHEGRAEVGEKSKLTTQKKTFGGYDCEFVESPTSAFQTECPICHLILCEPYQVTCCGTSFCQTCIQRLQDDNTSCPTCREDKFEMFPNKGLKRSLKQLQVYCTHRNGGCQWRGEFGELDQHLNISKQCPLTVVEKEKDAKQGSLVEESEMLKQEIAELKRQRDEDKEKFRYFGVLPLKITMTNFAARSKKHWLWRHSEEWFSPPFYTHPQGYKMCLSVFANGDGKGKGTHVSVFANLMRGEFDDVLKWPFQGHVVIQLCNQLQDKYHRGHTTDFSKTTDANVVNRVTTGERAENGMGCSTLIPHKDLNFNPATNSQYLKNDCLLFQIIAVESLSGPGVLPTERTMTCFEQHKISPHYWLSPPFYTHPQGYKMCFRVDANGVYGYRAHVSVSASLMRGEFDDHLQWPFRGHVTIAMLNQLEDNNHTIHTIPYTDTTDNQITAGGRVTEGELSPRALGSPNFIAHTELNYSPTKNCQYLKYDCLRFRIVKVELN